MEDTQIPWSRLSGFIRKHAHDVRNDLNSLDLESTLLEEIVPEGEAKEGVARIRKQVRALTAQMRLLSARFQIPSPFAAPMPAKVVLTIWQERCAALPKAPEFKWVDKLVDEKVNVDVEMIATVIQELIVNAAAFAQNRPITITAKSDKSVVIFEMQEPKTSPLDTRAWGQPFFSTRTGGHGLGIWTARRLVEANHGTLVQHFAPEASALISQVVLPRVSR
jgi:signal transduction histidine kinase